MGRPLLLDAWERPVTSVIIATCAWVWYYLNRRGLARGRRRVVQEGGAGAAVLAMPHASFSHVSPLHLLFNASSLWSLGVVEQMGSRRGPGWGSEWYLRYTLVMLVGTMVLVLASYHALVRFARLERYENVTAAKGYSSSCSDG